MQHTKHLWRAGLLLLLLPIGYIAMRQIMFPPTFGDSGFYRAANLEEQRDHQVMHAPVEECAACHAEQAEKRTKGVHGTVNCQVCHAPMATHVLEGKIVGKMRLPQIPDMCLKCHQALPARPKGFPQVDPAVHLQAQGMEMADGVCVTCHDAHSPGMGN